MADEVSQGYNPLYKLATDGRPTYIRHLSNVEDNPNSTGGTIEHHTYDIESQLLRGTMAFSKAKLQELDPSYIGYTHIFCVRVPPILTHVARGWQVPGFDVAQRGRRHCLALKTFFEMGCTSYSGTPDLTLNTSQVSIGWADRVYAAPTTAEYGSTSFSMNVLECRGDPLRRGIEYWISGVSDPNVKAAMMNGALQSEGGPLLEPTLGNFTWAFMIVQTDQTLLTIQDISLWNNCLINGVDRSNLDWENGTVDIVQPRSIQFTGVYMPDTENPYLKAMAEKLLGARLKFYKRYREMGEQEIGTVDWDEIGTQWES